MLGDFLYRLLERDAPLLEPFVLTRSLSAASAALLTTIPARDDRYLVITHFAANILPGLGQLPRSVSITAVDSRFSPAPRIIGLTFRTPDPPAGQVLQVTVPGLEVYVWPGAVLTLAAAFDIGSSVNTAELSLFGFLIPRGNLTLAAL